MCSKRWTYIKKSLLKPYYDSLRDLQENILVDNNWRGIVYFILKLYNIKLLLSKNQLVFPVFHTFEYSKNRIIRLINANTIKDKNNKKNYIFSPGSWVSHAFFNVKVLDIIFNNNKLINKNLYLVEGILDSMNLTSLNSASFNNFLLD